MPATNTDILTVNPLQFGLVGFVLILMWKVLDVGKTLFLASRNRDESDRQQEHAAGLSCQQDPMHFQRIREIHEYVKHTGDQINQGEFSCQWKDREEVRDYIDLQKKQLAVSEQIVKAMDLVAGEMRLLRQELVTTRSGRKV